MSNNTGRMVIGAAAALTLMAGLGAPANAQGRGPGDRTSPAADLVPLPDRMLQGTVSVRNTGAADAGPFVITVQCQKQGGGGCAEHPGMAAYANPAYPNRLVVNVASLKKGAVYNHALPFWKEMKWQPGNYNFLVQADAGLVVAETNEGNNIAGAVLKK
jgi:hypothetical protein